MPSTTVAQRPIEHKAASAEQQFCMIGKSTGAPTGDESMTWANAMGRVIVPVVGPILERRGLR
jgi:hypothetical protein